MARRHYRRPLVRHILILLAIPFALSGTGYALYTQNLSVDTVSSKPAYSSTQDLLMTYTPTVTQTGQKWAHSISMVVTNTGTLDVESWQVKVDIPADQSQLSCPATVSCSVVGTTLRVANGTTNGTIIGGDSLTIVWSYVTALDAYILQNVFVSGVRPSNFAPISGLTASYTQGSRTKSANIYSWPVTFTVTNNSGQNITAWQLSQDWSTAESVGTMPITVTYVASPPTLVITSTTGVNNGSNFQFTATLRSTNRNWAPTGIVVQGKL